jgi:hypothetical protein
MNPNLFAPLATVVVISITVVGQWISSRNDRSLTDQELEILSKLERDSKTAKDLSAVIETRIARWRQRMAESRHIAWRAVRWTLASLIIYGFSIYVFVTEPGARGWLYYLAIAGVCFFWAFILWLWALLERYREWAHQPDGDTP